MKHLVWFRSDLRINDNPALAAACRDTDDAVLAVFVVCPKQWKQHDWGAGRVQLMMRMVKSLSQDLEKLNIALLVRETDAFDGVPKLIANLAKEHECDRVHLNEEYEVNESLRDDEVEQQLTKSAIPLVRHSGAVALGPGSVMTQQGGWYTVFSPFKRRWLEVAEEEWGGTPDRVILDKPKKRAIMIAQPDEVPLKIKGFDGGEHIAQQWSDTERGARQVLGIFAEQRARQYKDKRDYPAIDATSRISPYLTHGTLSARECIARVAEATQKGALPDKRARDGGAHFISEILWREFYKHLLVGYPRLSMNRPFRTESKDVQWRDDDEGFQAWCEGRTGIPIVDAGMRQLVSMGWMHNRVRMITAMFLTKNLLVHWRKGEQFFMNHLVDGDLASNNGGWQWSASTGTDAAPYFRIMNPALQAERYDPEGEYIRQWVPELRDFPAKHLHDPTRMAPLERSAANYPEPLVDLKKTRQRAIDAFRVVMSGPAAV